MEQYPGISFVLAKEIIKMLGTIDTRLRTIEQILCEMDEDLSEEGGGIW